MTGTRFLLVFASGRAPYRVPIPAAPPIEPRGDFRVEASRKRGRGLCFSFLDGDLLLLSATLAGTSLSSAILWPLERDRPRPPWLVVTHAEHPHLIPAAVTYALRHLTSRA